MKPLILAFAEKPIAEELDYDQIEYDHRLNLSVHKETRLPAIDALHMETETFTKASGETSDSDRSHVSTLLDTETMTFVKAETSDSDKNSRALQTLLHTETFTRSSPEGNDQD